MTTPLSTPKHPRETGEQRRQHILSVVRQRVASRRPAPTIAELETETGLSETDVRHHVKWLAEQDPPQVCIRPARPMVVDLPEEVAP